ncbi:hypothetical protein HY489_01815 [Candidatus Woesearchaeota archaeon]|nr:hypothetical protein [Candidatus Woesearchaeota archaeon]
MEERFDVPLSDDVNIITRVKKVPVSTEYPIGVDFAVTGRVREQDDFQDVIRVDNSAHQGKPGTHVHYLDKEPRNGEEVVQYSPDIVNWTQAYDIVEVYLKTNYPMLL